MWTFSSKALRLLSVPLELTEVYQASCLLRMREAAVMITHLKPASTRTALALFCFV